MQEALAKKLVGMYKTIGGPQTGLQYRYISEQHVAATPSTYLSMALSLGKKKRACCTLLWGSLFQSLSQLAGAFFAWVCGHEPLLKKVPVMAIILHYYLTLDCFLLFTWSNRCELLLERA